jgi:four helix bundle protein
MADAARSRFEDLIAWQKARTLAATIRRLTAHPHCRDDRDLVWQVRRAAVSVMANVAESWDRGSRRDTIRFLAIAKASCAEVRSRLYVIHDAGLLDAQTFDELNASAVEVSRTIAGLKRSLAARR